MMMTRRALFAAVVAVVAGVFKPKPAQAAKLSLYHGSVFYKQRMLDVLKRKFVFRKACEMTPFPRVVSGKKIEFSRYRTS